MLKQESTITDVAPTLYIHKDSQRVIEDVEQVQEDLWTWWAEADLRPSPIRLFTRNNHLEDKYGNDLVKQAKAAGIIRKGRVDQERVEAEILGVENLATLLLSAKTRDGVVYVSPPGPEEEGFGGKGKRRLSFSYLYHVGNAGRIHFLAIPELELSTQDHLAKIEPYIDRSETKKIVGHSLQGMSDRDIVAYPFKASGKNSLDGLASTFGYTNLLDMWRSALEAKRLRGRAGDLIKHSSLRIWDAYQAKDYARLEVLGNVFRGVTALLVADDLHDVEDISSYFDSKVTAILGSQMADRMGGTTHAAYQAYGEQITEFVLRVKANKSATDIVEGGSCPGDKGLRVYENNWATKRDPFVAHDLLQEIVDVRDTGRIEVSINTSGSTGKYKEFYYYYPDMCRGPCESYKPYVAHPKSAEIGCGYYCSDCED